jgi:BirA family transcriptional regulator, biotin operon repressor / biotin---[acetyl-CoA-carboxylase] ligase
LCAMLGLTIAQFNEAVSACSAYGIPLQPCPSGGYRLSRPLELLDASAIIQFLTAAKRSALARLDILPLTDSTNQYLLEQAPPVGFHACLAEYQQAGRGRQGRRWLSPYASGLCLSLRHDQDTPPAPGLALALALSVAAALEKAGAREVWVKWPNDVLWQRRYKLAGLLVEGRSCGARQSLVMGLGMNIALPPEAAPPPDYVWADLQQAVGKPVSRNHIAAAVLSALMAAYQDFSAYGFAPFAALWARFDMLSGTQVNLVSADVAREVKVRGIDQEGALWVEENGEMQRYLSADVSVRP